VKKVLYIFALLLILQTTAIANNNKIYKALCLTKKIVENNVTIVKQKNGYQLVEYNGTKYVFITNSDMEMPNNNCKKDEIPLFDQP